MGSSGREARGVSFKKSKITAAAKIRKKIIDQIHAVSDPPPPPQQGQFFDCGAALLSRQFERDRDAVITRARGSDMCGMLCWFADVEKQAQLADLSKANSGFVYYSTGIHPDNIDRTNKKNHDAWLERINQLACKSECIAIMSGLNRSRDIGSHFGQETLLKACYQIAVKYNLPLVLHAASDGDSIDRIIEVLNEEKEVSGSCLVIIHDTLSVCHSDADRLSRLLTLESCYFMVSAVDSGLDASTSSEGSKASLLLQIPVSRMLLSSDSPWNTPQNIPDAYVRAQKNEPSNIGYVFESVWSVLSRQSNASVSMTREELKVALLSTSLAVFGLDTIASVVDSAATRSSTAVPASDILPVDQKPKSLSYYSCKRCRMPLFSSTQVLSHDVDEATRTIFVVGEKAQCTSTVFLPYYACMAATHVPDDEEVELSKKHFQSEYPNLSVLLTDSNAVKCNSCDVKFGQYFEHKSKCPCGASVSGPVIKVQTTKVDYCEADLTAEELAARATAETQQALEELALKEGEVEETGGTKKTKRRMKKVRGKGNYTYFRDKSFKPNASRVAKSMIAEGDAEVGGGSSSDGESNSNDDE